MMFLVAIGMFALCFLICRGIGAIMKELDRVRSANQHDLDIEGD